MKAIRATGPRLRKPIGAHKSSFQMRSIVHVPPIEGHLKGMPSGISYLTGMNSCLGVNEYIDRPLIIERQTYDSPECKTYSYRKFATDMHQTRLGLLNNHSIVPEGFWSSVSSPLICIGLITGRNYEFVVNLITLLSLKCSPVLINSSSTLPEIKHMTSVTKSSHILVPHLRYQEYLDSGAQGNIISNHFLQHDSPLLKISDLKMKYKISAGGREEKHMGTVLFTSGTTGKPKGVFTNATAIKNQCKNLITAWEYTPDDHILHTLPTHHIHGLVNALLAPLSAGTSIEFVQQAFNPLAVMERIAMHPTPEFPQVTMFHGVPTMYASFVSTYESLPSSKQSQIRDGLKRLRVAVCGSAALPTPIAEKWEKITGSIPLERYGMTEVGMALSNDIEPSKRILGSVGKPIQPNIVVELVDSNDKVISQSDVPGDLVIKWKMDTIFTEYYNNLGETSKARCFPIDVSEENFGGIDQDGNVITKKVGFEKHPSKIKEKRNKYFRTGDVAKRGKDGEYYILGRKSADIIKVAGHKISALEIEREILSIPEISEAVVVGVQSEKFGEIPNALVTLKQNVKAEFTKRPEYKAELLKEFKKQLNARISEEKRPRKWIILDEIPRNAMGKVNKKQLLKDRSIFPEKGKSSDD